MASPLGEKEPLNKGMQELVDKILAEGHNLGGGILKVDSFLNHQLQPEFTLRMGQVFAEVFKKTQPTRILTAEVSGIAPALATGLALGIPVVYARKKRPLTMNGVLYEASAVSRTKGEVVTLRVSSDYLQASDRILIIDDFLARGLTTDALVNIVQQAGAELVGIGSVVEKTFEGGRKVLEKHGVPIYSLALIESLDSEIVVKSPQAL